MALTLEIKPAEGPLSRVRLQPGNNRFSVRVGDTFRIYDDQTGLAPPGFAVKRVDNSLVVDGLPGAGAPTVVEFAEFYTLCSIGSPCELQLQEQALAPAVSITPGTASIGALADGAFVLYDPRYVPPPEPGGQPGSVDTRNVLYGVGALAVAGLALGGGGGDGSGDSGAGAGPAPPDGTLKLTSSTSFNNRTPVISGEGEPGASIVVRIDTNGDGVPNVTYATTVGADFKWSIDLASAAPQSGALPPGGLPDISTVGISSTTRDGTVSLPTLQLAFDGTPPAPPTIDVVAADNVVNDPEKQAGVAVAGGAEAGSTVLVTWGAGTMATAVDGAGRWQVVFPATAVPADGPQPLTAIVQDAAGNSSPGARLAVTVNTAAPPLAVASVAGGDGVVSIADAGSVRFIGATEAGAAVTLRWNGVAKPAIADPGGNWQVEFTGAEVPAGAGEPFAYTIVATNAVGNIAQASGQVLVDRVAPAAPVIGIVEGDDRVTVAERGNGVGISGTSEPGARVVVSWGNAANAKTTTADGAGHWSVGFASGEVPAVGSPGATTVITARATDPVGNAGDSGSRPVFVEQPFPPPTIGTVAGNDVVSAAERNAGITIGGTVNAAAPGVTVTWGTFSGPAAVVGGNWSINLAPGQVPGDGNTTVVAAITGSPDIASSRAVRIDTTAPPPPAIGAVEGDDRVSLAERQDGVRISGTAEAGATVNVDWNGNGKVTTANGAGAWSVDYGAGEVPQVAAGGGNTTITARATDGVGNAGASVQRAVFVEQPFPAPSIAPVAGDDVVNGAERSAGVVLSGTVQPGVTAVEVGWGGFSGQAAVAGSSWSIAVPSAQVPADGATTVIATIAGVGGGASQTRAVAVDTTGPATAIAPVTGDDLISFLERGSGFTISGTSEPNASVTVSLGGRAQTVIANAAGAWETGLYGGLDLPPLGGPAQVTATATDRFGNQGPPQARTIQVESTPFAISLQALLDTGDQPGSPAQEAASAATAATAVAAAPGEALASLSTNPLDDPLLAIGNPIPHLG